MIVGAALPFEENIAFTREAVDFCKSFGVPVEAELGAILGKEDDHVSEADCKTEPEKVQRFVEETGCDMLAVSIGNVHGLEDIPRIDIPLLQRIASVCPVPLVIHGGSGIDEEILRSFVNYKVAKVNIASDLRKAFITTVGKAWVNNNNEANLARVMANAKQAVEDDVYSKIQMMNKLHPAFRKACKGSDMIRQKVRVMNSTGLHARPAASLARIVKKYQSSLILVNNDKEIPIKGMMSILGAGVKGNTMIDLICDGQDELAFMDELKSAFAAGFGESE